MTDRTLRSHGKSFLWIFLFLILPFLEYSPLTALLPGFLRIRLSLVALLFLQERGRKERYFFYLHAGLVPDLYLGPALGIRSFSYFFLDRLLSVLEKYFGMPSPLRSALMAALLFLGDFLIRSFLLEVFGFASLGENFLYQFASLGGTAVFAGILGTKFSPEPSYELLGKDDHEKTAE